MAVEYRTREGDALDLICQREYGRQAGAVEAVLKANPQIAKVAHRLPAGVLVILPDLQPLEGDGMLRLWS